MVGDGWEFSRLGINKKVLSIENLANGWVCLNIFTVRGLVLLFLRNY